MQQQTYSMIRLIIKRIAWEGEVQITLRDEPPRVICFLIYPVAESKTAFFFNDRFVVNKLPHSRQEHRESLFSTSNSYPEIIPRVDLVINPLQMLRLHASWSESGSLWYGGHCWRFELDL